MHALEPAPQLHHGARDGEHLSGQCPRFFTITRQVQTRIGGRYPLVLLASDAPDAWKRPQLKAKGRQLRHWTKKVRQPFGAPTSGVRATSTTTPGDDDFEAGPVQAWFTQLVKATQGIKQSASPGGPSRPGRKPPVPPKPSFTPSAKKKLKFTPNVSSAELAQELPFSEESGTGP